jgi:heat shock transcription factor
MRKELHDAISKKRRRHIDQGPEADEMVASSSLEQESPVLFDPHKSVEPLAEGSVELLADGILPDLEGSVELLVDGIPPDLGGSVELPVDEIPSNLNDSGIDANGIPVDLTHEVQQNGAEGLSNTNFWEELLNEGLSDESDNPVNVGDMNVLAEKLGYLIPNSPTGTA